MTRTTLAIPNFGTFYLETKDGDTIKDIIPRVARIVGVDPSEIKGLKIGNEKTVAHVDTVFGTSRLTLSIIHHIKVASSRMPIYLQDVKGLKTVRELREAVRNKLGLMYPPRLVFGETELNNDADPLTGGLGHSDTVIVAYSEDPDQLLPTEKYVVFNHSGRFLNQKNGVISKSPARKMGTFNGFQSAIEYLVSKGYKVSGCKPLLDETVNSFYFETEPDIRIYQL